MTIYNYYYNYYYYDICCDTYYIYLFLSFAIAAVLLLGYMHTPVSTLCSAVKVRLYMTFGHKIVGQQRGKMRVQGFHPLEKRTKGGTELHDGICEGIVERHRVDLRNRGAKCA